MKCECVVSSGHGISFYHMVPTVADVINAEADATILTRHNAFDTCHKICNAVGFDPLGDLAAGRPDIAPVEFTMT